MTAAAHSLTACWNSVCQSKYQNQPPSRTFLPFFPGMGLEFLISYSQASQKASLIQTYLVQRLGPWLWILVLVDGEGCRCLERCKLRYSRRLSRFILIIISRQEGKLATSIQAETRTHPRIRLITAVFKLLFCCILLLFSLFSAQGFLGTRPPGCFLVRKVQATDAPRLRPALDRVRRKNRHR